jgi:hypothetical protein
MNPVGNATGKALTEWTIFQVQMDSIVVLLACCTFFLAIIAWRLTSSWRVVDEEVDR